MQDKDHVKAISDYPVREVIITDDKTNLDDLFFEDEAAQADVDSGVDFISEEELVVKRTL
jgi:hypothetical protein